MSQERTQGGLNCILGSLQKLTHVPLAIAILLVISKLRNGTAIGDKDHLEGSLHLDRRNEVKSRVLINEMIIIHAIVKFLVQDFRFNCD